LGFAKKRAGGDAGGTKRKRLARMRGAVRNKKMIPEYVRKSKEN
jgi:hypothetical protein